ncbi:hypothetical protein DFH07DRAFT_336024 [Mycena maculata]|uniref:Uncharacterized protein n=1 Tax=Mycena maculata TaxID=230809 RepID=A0AAD7HE24_9AGAR|nr:hypothetical protein DFH07DRAFT_336024 [Mycena maculata]
MKNYSKSTHCIFGTPRSITRLSRYPPFWGRVLANVPSHSNWDRQYSTTTPRSVPLMGLVYNALMSSYVPESLQGLHFYLCGNAPELRHPKTHSIPQISAALISLLDFYARLLSRRSARRVARSRLLSVTSFLATHNFVRHFTRSWGSRSWRQQGWCGFPSRSDGQGEGMRFCQPGCAFTSPMTMRRSRPPISASTAHHRISRQLRFWRMASWFECCILRSPAGTTSRPQAYKGTTKPAATMPCASRPTCGRPPSNESAFLWDTPSPRYKPGRSARICRKQFFHFSMDPPTP